MRIDAPVSIIVACRNEESNIEECVRRICAAAPSAEVIVVDGGNDRTEVIVTGLHPLLPQVVYIKNVGDRGKGHAVQVGIMAATHDIMLNIDADLQFEPEEMHKLVSPIVNDGRELVCGSRYLPGAVSDVAPLARSLGNKVLGLYASFLCGRRVTDLNAGFKAWSRRAIQEIGFEHEGSGWEAEFLVRAALSRKPFREVPVRHHERVAGRSIFDSPVALIRGAAILFRIITMAWWKGRGAPAGSPSWYVAKVRDPNAV
jgi:glycosyltransferase involved in cell wall biosynthesis